MQRIHWLCLAAFVGLGISALGGGPATAVPTTEFTVTGDVTAPATYDLGELSALPATTETVTFKTGAGPHTGTFTGPTLWSLLNTVGLQTPAVKNGVLRQYVVGEGSDGYTALFSLGELNPNFGGSAPQVLGRLPGKQRAARLCRFRPHRRRQGRFRRPLRLQPGKSPGRNRTLQSVPRRRHDHPIFPFRRGSDAGNLYAVDPPGAAGNDRDRHLSRRRRPGDRRLSPASRSGRC